MPSRVSEGGKDEPRGADISFIPERRAACVPIGDDGDVGLGIVGTDGRRDDEDG